jgi:adenine-specific DNA-methyltransferase
LVRGGNLQGARLSSTGPGLYYIRYCEDFRAFREDNVWSDTGIAGFASEKRYVVETSEKVVQRCILMTTDPGDLVLDPTLRFRHNGLCRRSNGVGAGS